VRYVSGVFALDLEEDLGIEVEVEEGALVLVDVGEGLTHGEQPL
jgi:hypothetical protein